MKTQIVVGEKFAAFADGAAAIRVSELRERLARPGGLADGVAFELGQGVSPANVDVLLQLAQARGLRDRLLFDRPIKCGTAQVHKLRPENSVLSVPAPRGPSTFAAELLLDDECELLSDHLGGLHLPGMVLVEAARQMGLAVIEQFFAAPEFPDGCAFLWSSMNVRFLQFAFPVRTEICCVVRERRVVKSRRVAMALDVACVQAGAQVAAADITCELRDRRAVERQEQGLAALASRAGAAARPEAGP